MTLHLRLLNIQRALNSQLGHREFYCTYLRNKPVHIEAWENSNLLRKVQRRQHKKELYIYIMNFQLSLTLLSFNFVKIKNGLQTYQNASFKGTHTFPPPKKVHGEIAFGISKKAISGGLVT